MEERVVVKRWAFPCLLLLVVAIIYMSYQIPSPEQPKLDAALHTRTQEDYEKLIPKPSGVKVVVPYAKEFIPKKDGHHFQVDLSNAVEVRFKAVHVSSTDFDPTVCGTSESKQRVMNGKGCFQNHLNLPDIISKHHYQHVSFPKDSIISTFPPEKTSVLAPIPGSPLFKNFTIYEARELVRGKTIVFGGDSTSRRIMYAFCAFLSGNPELLFADDADRITMDTDRGKHHYEYHLCAFDDLDLDVAVSYGGMTSIPTKREVVENLFVSHYGMRKARPDLYPNQKQSAYHFFAPFYDFHYSPTCLPNYDSADYVTKSEVVDCGKFVGDYFPKDLLQNYDLKQNLNESVCTIVETFYKDMDELLSKVHDSLDPEVNVFVHGMTNVVSGLGEMQIYAKNLNFFSYIPMLAGYAHEMGEDMCEDVRKKLGYTQHDWGNVLVDFMDQASWMMEGTHFDSMIKEFKPKLYNGEVRRHPKFWSFTKQYIHNDSEQAQLMRVQTVFNRILHSENRIKTKDI